ASYRFGPLNRPSRPRVQRASTPRRPGPAANSTPVPTATPTSIDFMASVRLSSPEAGGAAAIFPDARMLNAGPASRNGVGLFIAGSRPRMSSGISTYWNFQEASNTPVGFPNGSVPSTFAAAPLPAYASSPWSATPGAKSYS